ncbi:MAG TPA: hypothetical protein VMF30_08505 [Pirellulales bacterium]|nr:hypothetical protein [Pirellulales bacterium]
MSPLRQYLVILAAGLWLGGFTFYATVVVPTGAEILGGSTEQGFITRVVTWYLNLIAAGALAVLLWNVLATRGKLLAATWLAMAGAQVALFVLHPRLDAMLDPATHGVADEFHILHEVYLWIAAVQWGLGLAHVWLVLAAWRNAANPASVAHRAFCQRTVPEVAQVSGARVAEGRPERNNT